ncbi:MAG: nucleotidyltransferase domain-containing protein, partial [Elusimicrobiota bacterium]
NTQAEWSGRQIAKEINVSPPTCHKALRELYSERVIILRSAGVTHLYKLNKTNYIVENILSEIFQKEKIIPKVLNNLIIKELKSSLREKIASVILFGSVARKKEKATGDIDLMLVIKRVNDKRKTEQTLNIVNSKIIELFNRRIEPYLLTLSELKRKQSLPVIKEVIKSGKLLLGKSLTELL